MRHRLNPPRRTVEWAGPWLLLLWLLGSSAARADVFSPGDLSNAHANLEGLKNCTACHVAGGKLAQEKCLSCHTELQHRIQAGSGYHGKMAPAQRECENCHHEHQGRSFDLFEWSPSKKGFPHERTGFALKGKHAQVDCAACHQKRRIEAADIQALLEKHPKAQTYLGLSTACASCHFDEHRGQLGQNCKSCHTEQSWKPAPGFDHAKTQYPLEGKHRAVACQKCHILQEDHQTPHDAFPAPASFSFITFANVQHASCADCHADPHENRFGQRCASCHTPTGWHIVRNGQMDRAFHDKTRYPLRGLHVEVPCKDCHGPTPGHPAKFRGIAFQTCASCHPDVHLGQLGRSGKGAPDCASCHTVEGFTPPRFEVSDHQQRTRFALDGAHRAVACGACHPQQRTLINRLPAPVQRELKLQGRSSRFSFALFDIPGNLARCDTCHKDPHAGQFAKPGAEKPCTACHQTTAFTELHFDHAKDSRFPLTGKHAAVPCSACHVAKAVAKGPPVVRYRPLETACGACHADVHAGQFATSGGPTGCETCHTTEDFKKLLFTHAPPFTGFLLEGKHASAHCESCHPLVEVAPGTRVRRFRPLPSACEDCHVDFHKGAFQGFSP